MQQSTRNLLTVGIGVLAALLVVNAAIGYRQIEALYGQSEGVIHTLKVETALDSLLQAVTDAETGQRGYLLTGQKRYLAPYDTAGGECHARIEEISRLTADNHRQGERIARLAELVQTKLAELAETIELYNQDEHGPQNAARVVLTDHGQLAMEKIRALVAEMSQEEQALLERREAASAQTLRSAKTTVWLSALVHLAGLAGFLWLLNWHVRSIRRSNAALHEQKEVLRATLASIGDGVIATDSQGRVTFMNSVAANLTGWPIAEATGQPLETVFHIVNEETRKVVENPAIRALREGRIFGLANHTVLIARDGREWPIDDSAAPIADATLAPCGAVLVFREISERAPAGAGAADPKIEARGIGPAQDRIPGDAGP